MKLISKLVSLCKKVYFSVLSFSQADNPYLLHELKKDYGIYIPRDNYPDIDVYLDQLKTNPNVDYWVAIDDTDFLRETGCLGASTWVKEHILEPRAILFYDNKDDLIPLIFTFSNNNKSEILYCLLYSNKTKKCIAVCIYNPSKSVLAMYYTTNQRVSIRVGISVVFSPTYSIWSYDNYFSKDSIKATNLTIWKYGQIWFTQPFPKIKGL